MKRGPCETTGVKVTLSASVPSEGKTLHDFYVRERKEQQQKKSITPHVIVIVFLTHRRLYPSSRTLGIYLEHDLSYISTCLCYGGPSSRSRMSAGHPRHQYQSLILKMVPVSLREDPKHHTVRRSNL